MTATIQNMAARRVWDSGGNPTAEVEVYTNTGVGRAIAPAGASRGMSEAIDLCDGGDAVGGVNV